MPLEIAQLGQPVLRRVADPVPASDLLSPEFQALLDEMRATMTEAGGVGLAAPQVFVSQRVFLACITPRDPEKPDEVLPIEVFINPELTFVPDKIESSWEGCLSFQELLVFVPRYHAVLIKYVDEQGNEKQRALSGFPARVVQHEFDHLNGVLTIDRALTTLDIVKASEIEDVLEEPQSKPVEDKQ